MLGITKMALFVRGFEPVSEIPETCEHSVANIYLNTL